MDHKQEHRTPSSSKGHGTGRVPTVMENPGKSWEKKLSWKLKNINKVMETEEYK